MSDKISIIHKSLKIRLYPTEDQKILFNKAFGCCRFVYNKHKEEKDNFYNENIKDRNLSKKEIKEIFDGRDLLSQHSKKENSDSKDSSLKEILGKSYRRFKKTNIIEAGA